VGHLLRRSKNLSSVLSSANSAGSLSPSSSLSSSSSEPASAPNGFELVLPRVLGAVAEAKLVRPPPEPAAPKPPLNPEKPEPNAANPVAAGFAVSAGVDSVDDLKIEGVEAPKDPKGDCSELANAAKLDEAKAEVDVAGFSSSAGFEVDVEPPIEPNGDTEDVFANALGRGAYRKVSFSPC
jgi:hypothetical protein